MLFLAYLYDRQIREARRNPISKSYAGVFLFLLGAVYVITEGCRYGRGVDQLGNYGPFYLHCMNANLWFQDFETLFVWLNQAVYKIDPLLDTLPFGSIFIVYAIIFFVCLFIYYKDKRQDTKLFLVFAILATNYITEWTIRQGVSFSFILLGLHFLEHRKWKSMACAMIVAFSIHHGNILAISLPIIFYFFLNKKAFSWKITVPLFIILEYTMQVSFFQNFITKFSAYFDLAALSGNFGGYFQDSSLAMEAQAAEDWARGPLTQLITVLFYSSILFIGAKSSKKSPKITYLYNAFVIGIMIYEPFRQAGSITRMFNVLSCLWFVPIAYAAYNYKKLYKANKWIMLAFAMFVLYLISYYGRYIFLNPDASYTWDQ